MGYRGDERVVGAVACDRSHSVVPGSESPSTYDVKCTVSHGRQYCRWFEHRTPSSRERTYHVKSGSNYPDSSVRRAFPGNVLRAEPPRRAILNFSSLVMAPVSGCT